MSRKGIYGIQFDPANPTSVVRLFDAEGLCYRQQTADMVLHSDFDDCYPWSEMKECNLLADGGIVYAGESGFSRSSNTFVEVPAFYFKRTVEGNVEQWVISGEPREGFQIEPWFLNEDGTVANCRYIGKYEGCDWQGGLVSVTGQVPFRFRSIDEIRQGCREAGFQLCSVYAYLALQHLFVIECGTLDSQSINSGVSFIPYSSRKYCRVIQSGKSNTAVVPCCWRWEFVEPGTVIYISEQVSADISTWRRLVSVKQEGDLQYITLSGPPIEFEAEKTRIFASAQATGQCDGLSYANGRPTENCHIAAFVYRGIENLYGNIWERMDDAGYVNSDEHIRIGGQPLSFVTPLNCTYGESGEGFIAKLGYDPEKPWATFPCAVGAEKGTHYCSEWSNFGDDDSILVFGGGWDHFHCNGIFCTRTVERDTKNWLYGYRAMKL